MCSYKKSVFLKISQNSQENTCARVCSRFQPATLLKKRLWHRCFPVNFAKLLRTLFYRTPPVAASVHCTLHCKIARSNGSGVSVKNLLLKMSTATLLKKRLWDRCFPVNFAKFLRTLIFLEHFWWLLLNS